MHKFLEKTTTNWNEEYDMWQGHIEEILTSQRSEKIKIKQTESGNTVSEILSH